MQTIQEDMRTCQETFEFDGEGEEGGEPLEFPPKFGYQYKDLQDVEKALGLIRLSWPEVELEDERLASLPPSYQTTTEKEKLLLWHAENFRKQFHTIYRDRRPLLLVCDNECGIQKFVSTNIKPSTLSYPQLHTWLGCAKFVSDHLAYEPLSKPLALPERLCSPTWMLITQTANSFEYSTLLVSLLLGQGYNAYVVSGYASKEQTMCDLSMRSCPYLPITRTPPVSSTPEDCSRYRVKSPPDFRSKLLLEMEELERQRLQDEVDNQERERQRMIHEQEQPPPDKFWGHRVHSWVLILPNDSTEGTRYEEIKSPVFIEATSGYFYDLSDPETRHLYHGIESVWNDRNYWVNMQICTESCTALTWDLDNTSHWERLLPGEPSRLLLSEDKEEDYNVLQDKHLDMPFPYVDEIQISSLDFERRYPNGRKILLFKKIKSEFFAPYVQMDGLTSKMTEFEDYEYQSPVMIMENYQNRGDKLVESIKDLISGSVSDSYERGRPDACKEHKYSSMGSNSVEDERSLEFFDVMRIDGLRRIDANLTHLNQHYVNRKDFLYHRSVLFSTDNGPIPQHNIHYRKISRITEMFRRDESVDAHKDVAIREFSIDDNEIRLKYHYGEDEITRASRIFVKPPVAERGERLVFDETMTTGYHPDPMAQPPKSLELFYLLEMLLRDEVQAVNYVRDAEKEISVFLKTRKKEYFMPRLIVSMFDRNRNEEAKAGMFAKEELLRAQSQREVEEDIDYLRPFLARLGNPKALTKLQAYEVRQECLNDLKITLTNRANDILRRFENCKARLQQLQRKSAEDEDLSKEEKEKLNEEINEVNLIMHTLDIRLKRHVELSSDRYRVMVRILDEDERLLPLKGK
ncbi:coiled-coil domain-containing protein lobo homolog [Fopius arisanus]|uniref:Dynein regulatory complex subunit 7 n=2 Tax=Fopius arisanus TaxID=64838 RepID=A0A9R1U0G0_9HYME|nr:PREDICTED: coiled-coil domain-containing protein lobo homolog [Fopius arisanus]